MVHEHHEPHERVLFAEEVFRIQGAIFEVNLQMGAGFLEAVYQECLALELAARHVPFSADVPLPLAYRGQPLKHHYRADFVCFDRIILELKALSAILPEHRAQMMNYLHVTKLKLGLLVNFGCAPKARIERIVL
jgi:GxxExxY protein